jgi:hypothetical protein
MSDRQFWIIVYNALVAIGKAIKRKHIDTEELGQPTTP